MDMSQTSLKAGFVFVFLTLLYSLAMWNSEINQKIRLETEVKELRKQLQRSQQYSDSLSMELFPKEIELSRYETAFEIFMRRNPKAASQYGDIISEETE